MNAISAELLIKSYYCDLKKEFFKDGARPDAIMFLLRDNLISYDEDDKTYKITDRGRVLVEYWLNTPLPTQTWVVNHPNN